MMSFSLLILMPAIGILWFLLGSPPMMSQPIVSSTKFIIVIASPTIIGFMMLRPFASSITPLSMLVLVSTGLTTHLTTHKKIHGTIACYLLHCILFSVTCSLFSFSCSLWNVPCGTLFLTYRVSFLKE